MALEWSDGLWIEEEEDSDNVYFFIEGPHRSIRYKEIESVLEDKEVCGHFPVSKLKPEMYNYYHLAPANLIKWSDQE